MAGIEAPQADHGEHGSSWGGLPSERKPGLLNRVYDRMMSSPLGSAAVIGASVSAAIAASSAAAISGVAAYDAHRGASFAPIHVAALAQGIARPDYGYANLTVEAMSDSKGDPRAVHAAADSEPTRGAVALGAMLGEMRLITSSPIVVHAYDPFIKDAAGKVSLDLDGLREVAPAMAKDGVKVAMVPFSVSNSAAGREMSSIMKKNGIAVVAPSPERGVAAAPDIVTVRGSANFRQSSPAHLEAQGDSLTSVGRIAANGAIYAMVNPELRGSAALGHEMQSRIEQGKQIKVMGGATATTIRLRTVQAVPGVKMPAPRPVQLAQASPAQGPILAIAAGQGR